MVEAIHAPRPEASGRSLADLTRFLSVHDLPSFCVNRKSGWLSRLKTMSIMSTVIIITEVYSNTSVTGKTKTQLNRKSSILFSDFQGLLGFAEVPKHAAHQGPLGVGSLSCSAYLC